MPRLLELRYRSNAPLAPGAFEGLSGLRYLTINGEIAHLPAGVLRGLPSLQRLEVDAGADDGTSTTTVAPALFDGLTNLTQLELRDLAEVPEGLFAGLSALRELRLQYNAFTSLPPRVFEGLSSLRFLFLDNHQTRGPTPYRHELTTLPPGLLSGLPHLELLHLGNVGLRHLRPGAFREVGSTLRFLYLQNNKLSALDPGTFSDLPELHTLNLAHNQLVTLPSGVFDNLPHLREIRLEDNHLTALPPGLFHNLRLLSWLRLHGNQLTTLPPGLFAFLDQAGIGAARHALQGLALHGNPGAPFALAFDPVVVSPAWQRPVRIAARLAEGAPIPYEVALGAVGARLEAESATIATGRSLSDSLAVWPVGRSAIVVRVSGLPDAGDDADCAALFDAGRNCNTYPGHTGLALEAGAPLVLNGVAARRQFDEPAEIDLANVFLEFDAAAAPTFSVRSSNPSVATAELAEAWLKVAPGDAGTATITVTATAADGTTATRAFSVTVPSYAERPFLRGWRLTLLETGNVP